MVKFVKAVLGLKRSGTSVLSGGSDGHGWKLGMGSAMPVATTAVPFAPLDCQTCGITCTGVPGRWRLLVSVQVHVVYLLLATFGFTD